MKAAVFYSFNTVKTAQVAEAISKAWGKGIESVNADEASGIDLTKFDFSILGVPTWFDGELPNYWDEMIPEIEELDLKGKKFALFGLGDQINYPQNFVDAIGVLGRVLEEQGAEIIGFTSTVGYSFESSRGIKDDKFYGLAVDLENRAEMLTEQIQYWVKDLKSSL